MKRRTMRERVEFFQLEAAQDEYGNDHYGGFESDPFLTTRGDLQRATGDERIVADKPEASAREVLVIRAPNVSITATHKVEVNGTAYQIRDVLTHRAGRYLEIVVERGVSI